MINPLNFMQMLGGRNPQREAMQMLNRISPNNQMASNLLNMINNGNEEGAMQMIQNMANERGINIDQLRGMLGKR